jgi:predicted  nucleic acid-binding Zn-ribbon protein
MLRASQMEVKDLHKTIEELKTANVGTSLMEQKKMADLQALNASLFETIASLNTSLQTLRTSIEGLTEPISPTVWASEPDV